MCTYKDFIFSAIQRAPLNSNVNYVTVIKYTCTCQISYKTEIFKSFSREPKSCIVQKHKIFAPERYTADFLYTDGLNSAWYETTVYYSLQYFWVLCKSIQWHISIALLPCWFSSASTYIDSGLWTWFMASSSNFTSWIHIQPAICCKAYR